MGEGFGEVGDSWHFGMNVILVVELDRGCWCISESNIDDLMSSCEEGLRILRELRHLDDTIMGGNRCRSELL